MSPHALDKTGTRHTDTQWKAKGGEGMEQKPLNARGIPCMHKHTNPTDQLPADTPSCLPG